MACFNRQQTMKFFPVHTPALWVCVPCSVFLLRTMGSHFQHPLQPWEDFTECWLCKKACQVFVHSFFALCIPYHCAEEFNSCYRTPANSPSKCVSVGMNAYFRALSTPYLEIILHFAVSYLSCWHSFFFKQNFAYVLTMCATVCFTHPLQYEAWHL